MYVHVQYVAVQVVVEAERRCRQELQAMRERHRARFMEATAKLRSQHKSLAKRARALETQLTKNSVSIHCNMYMIVSIYSRSELHTVTCTCTCMCTCTSQFSRLGMWNICLSVYTFCIFYNYLWISISLSLF